MSTELALVVGFLGVISLCLITLTILLLGILQDLHRTIRHLNSSLLPTCDKAFEEAHRTLKSTRQLMARLHQTAGQVEQTVHQTQATVSEFLKPFIYLKGKAQAFFEDRFRNGAGSAPPRSVHRVKIKAES